jgi:uncharacterized DUF497 family protein
MEVRFAWDAQKAAQNRRKHGVSFEQAREVFDDPNHVVLENYRLIEEGEQRYQAIGLSGGMALLAVVFVDRSEDDEQVMIRLISARKANRYEKYLYQAATAR